MSNVAEERPDSTLGRILSFRYEQGDFWSERSSVARYTDSRNDSIFYVDLDAFSGV